MNVTLAAWNEADYSTELNPVIACCGARRWAAAMVAQRPITSAAELCDTADRVWSTMEEADWVEAFACHPRIGERKATTTHAKGQAEVWSRQEQAATENAPEKVLSELVERTLHYEQRFGITYIVCATGKSAEEMLAILNRRLTSDRASEFREAAEQQRQILQIRLRKWLAE